MRCQTCGRDDDLQHGHVFTLRRTDRVLWIRAREVCRRLNVNLKDVIERLLSDWMAKQ